MLILPTATYRATAFLRAAEALGLQCVVASDEAPTLAALMDGRLLTLDLGHPEEAADRAAAFVQKWPVDAVVGVDEASVLTAAHIATRLGVARNPLEAVAATASDVHAKIVWICDPNNPTSTVHGAKKSFDAMIDGLTPK